MIRDNTIIGSDVFLSNISINNINGLVYDRFQLNENYIQIMDLQIITDQLNKSDDALFNFPYTAVVSMSRIEIIYNYDAGKHCYFDKMINNSAMNASCDTYICDNPITFINNQGQIHIDSLTVNNIVNYPNNQHRNSEYVRYEYNDALSSAFIVNEGTGTINISNSNISQTICYWFIFNANYLNFINVSINTELENPNNLYSVAIVGQSGLISSSTITYSHLTGPMWCIYVFSGSLYITNSTLQNSTTAIQSPLSNEIIIDNCDILYNGAYNGIFMSEYNVETRLTVGVQMWDSECIILRNNRILGFDPHGLVMLVYSNNITVYQNTFNIDASGLFYNISDRFLEFIYGWAPLMYYGSSYVMTLSNMFMDNKVDPNQQWISYWYGEEMSCLSGNDFTDYAIFAFQTNITSCFRPDIINCIDTICNNVSYGSINPDLFNITSNIVVKHNNHVFWPRDSNIALDNIHFWISNESVDDVHIILDGNRSSIMLIDSYVMNKHDLSYYGSYCDLLNNQRLINNNQYISTLLLSCTLWTNETLENPNQTMNSSITTFSAHLSPVQIELISNSTTYYPGQLLTFDYLIMDTLNNIINKSSIYLSDDIVITLKTDNFLTDLEISTNKECDVCQTGILFNSVSLKDDIGDTLSLSMSISDNILYPSETELSLMITGCPRMSGPGSNNYTCIQCNTDYYNIKEDKLEECIWCDPKKNQNIQCIEGTIWVGKDSWLGFDGDAMISAKCVIGHCCQQVDDCDYLEDKSKLCANNRDYGSVLCSRCKDGYSESMNSVSCVKCSGFYWKYIVQSFCYSILWILYIMIVASEKMTEKADLIGIDLEKKSKCNCRRFTNNGCYRRIGKFSRNEKLLLALRSILNRNVIYYMQALSQLLSGGSYLLLFGIFIQIFNFSVITDTNNTNDDESWCFVDGLQAKEKIYLGLSIPAFITIYFIGMYIICRVFTDGKITISCIQRQILFDKMLIELILLLIGSILAVLFKLMACAEVGNKTVHLHFGYESCYESTWNISLVIMIVIVIAFSFIFIKLRISMPEQRESDNNPLILFMVIYKPEYYFWEYVIFIRRICIAFYSVSVENDSFALIFITVLVIFLSFHIQCQPFVIDGANKLETILLVVLIIIVTSQELSSIPYGANISHYLQYFCHLY